MNAVELEQAVVFATSIERAAAELYETFAQASPADSEERQFWQLLSYEEKTHAQVLELVASHIDPMPILPPDEVPGPLRNDLQGLRTVRDWLYRTQQASARIAGEQLWMAQIALELEASEADRVLDWMLHLPVPHDTRLLIHDLTRGTGGHVKRLKDFLARQRGECLSLPASY